MSALTRPRTSSGSADGSPPEGGRPHGREWLLAVVAAASAAGITAGLLIATGATGPSTAPPTTVPATTAPATTLPSQPTTTTTVPPTTTTVPPTTTLPPATASELAQAVYPTPDLQIRFAHPVAAARAFAVEYVGFVDPVVGPFVASGEETGTVDVQAATGGAATSVTLRHMGDSWWVLGASTPHIVLDSPAAMDAITSPVRLQGTSTAFEGTVSVEVREDGRRAAIGSGFVTGGGMGVMGPFDGTLTFREPIAARGALVLFTVSMENGDLWEATVVRVAFAAASPSLSTGVLSPIAPSV